MRYSKRLVLWLLGFTLACFIGSLILPAWTMGTNYSGGLGLDVYPIGASVSGGWMDLPNGFYFLTELHGDLTGVLVILLSMTILTIILLVIQLIIIRKKDETSITQKLSGLTILIAILTLLTPLIFAYLWPSTLTREAGYTFQFNFWGSYTYGIYSISWGPNVGWFLQILGFIMIVIIIIVTLASKETKQITEDRTPSERLTCPYCNSGIQADYIRCPNCGVILKKKCVKCGNLVDFKNKLCPFCGSNDFTDASKTIVEVKLPEESGQT